MKILTTIKVLKSREETEVVADQFIQLSIDLFGLLAMKSKLSEDFLNTLRDNFLAINLFLEILRMDKIEANSMKEVAVVYLNYYSEVINSRI